MDVEYTGRQAVVTEEIRSLTEPYLDRMEKMLGSGGSAHVVLTTEKHRQIAEVTIKTRATDLVGLCESGVLSEAALRQTLQQALGKAEAQAIRFKEKRDTQRRLPKDEKSVVETSLERPGRAKRTSLLNSADSPLDAVLGLAPDGVGPTLVQPISTKSGHAANGNGNHAEFATEPHVTRTIEAVALSPMSLEEAIKELETRNRELFVFRDKAGHICVLHCKRDGTLELVELP
ncbi:HPF/RaiA family ribosome-associated protein [Acidipila sp. EB88]|uniref:HPF/RaiA family ribosome-associated protein n=1 Tax=Acidipila sp. EB88 TaxID=2305226 RepID=UPI000F5F17BB|nr:sigma 54 modulation/S30EA ribosomal C-terminal domain-containing protein [Acidipila sp. EB88]RRA49214.1 hypothetical protein D1Y84_13970 [Acidipila sp. EB88]